MKKITVMKPWGKFEQFTINEVSTVKFLHVNPGKRLSLQSHKHREEFWKIVQGPVRIVVGDVCHLAKVGDEFIIPKNAKHRAEGIDNEGIILEISFGKFDENDLVRHEDDFGRK
jgi:mannose-6-phosphate isomerase